MFLTWLCIQCCSGFLFIGLITALSYGRHPAGEYIVWFPPLDLLGWVKPYLMHYGDLEWKIALSVTVCPLLRTVFQTTVPCEWSCCCCTWINITTMTVITNRSVFSCSTKIGNIERQFSQLAISAVAQENMALKSHVKFKYNRSLAVVIFTALA